MKSRGSIASIASRPDRRAICAWPISLTYEPKARSSVRRRLPLPEAETSAAASDPTQVGATQVRAATSDLAQVEATRPRLELRGWGCAQREPSQRGVTGGNRRPPPMDQDK